MNMFLLRVLTIAGLCWPLACSGRKSEPPPPASSAAVPQAAPNARGTMASDKAPQPGLTAPRQADDEGDPTAEDPEPADPSSPASPADSGVTL